MVENLLQVTDTYTYPVGMQVKYFLSFRLWLILENINAYFYYKTFPVMFYEVNHWETHKLAGGGVKA